MVPPIQQALHGCSPFVNLEEDGWPDHYDGLRLCIAGHASWIGGGCALDPDVYSNPANRSMVLDANYTRTLPSIPPDIACSMHHTWLLLPTAPYQPLSNQITPLTTTWQCIWSRCFRCNSIVLVTTHDEALLSRHPDNEQYPIQGEMALPATKVAVDNLHFTSMTSRLLTNRNAIPSR